MPTWKRLFIRATGFGVGAATAATIVTALMIWYAHRPAKPKPWDRAAITAKFYRVSTTGEKDSELDFEYVLENNTDADYELQTHSSLKIAAKLEDTNSLTGFADEKAIVLKLPIFVPAHQKTRISVTTPGYGFSTTTRITDSSTSDERHKHYIEVADHVTQHMSNLNGFVLFDEGKRLQIELPNGWKDQIAEEKAALKDSKAAGK